MKKKLAFIIAFCVSTSISADDLKRGEGVTERYISGYEPIGIKVGSFLLHTSLESENEWNDNIFSTQDSLVDDFIFHLKPSLDVTSNWKRHGLGFSITRS